MTQSFQVTNFIHFQKIGTYYIISLHYHQSNSLEGSIQTVYQTLSKAKLNSENHFLAMLYHLPKVPPPKSILLP